MRKFAVFLGFLAGLLAVAFISIPIYLYFFGDPNLVQAASGGH